MNNSHADTLGDFDMAPSRRQPADRLGRLLLAMAIVTLWGHALLLSLIGQTAYAQGGGRPASALSPSSMPGLRSDADACALAWNVRSP